MTESPLQQAARVGAVATIADVRQIATSARLHRIVEAPFDVDLELSYEWEPYEHALVCEVSCAVVVREEAALEDGPAFTAEVTVGGTFLLPADAIFTTEQFEAFAQINGTFSLYPYLREAVQMLTTRAGMPPLVLAPLRMPLMQTGSDAPRTAPAGSLGQGRTSADAPSGPTADKPAARKVPAKAAAKKAVTRTAARSTASRVAAAPPSKRQGNQPAKKPGESSAGTGKAKKASAKTAPAKKSSATKGRAAPGSKRSTSGGSGRRLS